MKAGEIIDRIKSHLGVPWRDATYRDTFKTGGPDTEVTGIATTAFVTLDVIRKASAAGLNMIIPHEDTFWNDRDDVATVEKDSLYAQKRAELQLRRAMFTRKRLLAWLLRTSKKQSPLGDRRPSATL